MNNFAFEFPTKTLIIGLDARQNRKVNFYDLMRLECSHRYKSLRHGDELHWILPEDQYSRFSLFPRRSLKENAEIDDELRGGKWFKLFSLVFSNEIYTWTEFYDLKRRVLDKLSKVRVTK